MVRSATRCYLPWPLPRIDQDSRTRETESVVLELLALDILLNLDQDCDKENRALLSIVAGFFARVDIMVPQSSIFEEVSNLIEILRYR